MQRRTFLKGIRSAAVIAAMAGSAALAPAEAQEIVFKLAHEAPATAIKGRTADLFAELVAKYTDGSVKIEVYPGGQLVPTVEEIRAAARGQVDIIAPYTSYYSSIDPLWDIFYQPMLFSSPKQAMEVFSGEIGQKLLANLESRRLKGLAIWHDGPVYTFTTDKPATTPDVLSGMKVRVAPSKPLESMLSKAGAAPISMPATEVYLALQQGTVDGVVTTPTYAAPARWGEVLKTMTRALWGVGGYGVAMNAKSFASMSAEQQEGFLRAMKEATEWNQAQTLENIAKSESMLKESGMTIVDLTDEQKAAWMPLAEAVWAEQSDDIKAMIDTIRQ
ncbi:TRAP transporter substrate-binding protein [Acuticoccus mangrovi]|uniref:TRAP transporter substrate-binding protein n=1 Tax=Acuticoccus mangrovi TaxID=2796142 RepID=A0A934ILJ6_9HYPH|nr:TRAP transporter substrate-binding protein [Acuticoccus mangrovi]MBJ3774150.1 TRAP transporter substrate-binding protein [Acuticoccus mangrovi]